MVLPLVPVALIAIGALTGGSGITLGGKAALDFKKASNQLSEARERYEERRAASEQAIEATNQGLRELGSQQQQCAIAIVGRMTEFLRRNARQVRERDRVIVDGIDVTMVDLPERRGVDVPTDAIVGGLIGSALAGAGTNAAVASTATAIGTASTGAAISGLSGVAAENAALAWLGGGSLSAGGGGMAMGAAAMNFVTIGPALLVTGLVASGQGAKALTQARAYDTEIATNIAELDESDARLAAVDTRVAEIGDLLSRVAYRAHKSLDLLESEPFERAAHEDRFQRALALTRAIAEVATTPIIDGAGQLSDQAADLKIKYRTLTKESDDA